MKRKISIYQLFCVIGLFLVLGIMIGSYWQKQTNFDYYDSLFFEKWRACEIDFKWQQYLLSDADECIKNLTGRNDTFGVCTNAEDFER